MTSFIKKIGSPVKIIFLGIIFSLIATLIISVGQIPRDIFPAFVENNMPYISRYIYTIVAFILLIWWLKWWNKSVTPIYMNNTLFQKKELGLWYRWLCPNFHTCSFIHTSKRLYLWK